MRSQTCRPMMDTYIMTSDTMDAVPLVAADMNNTKQLKHSGLIGKVLINT